MKPSSGAITRKGSEDIDFFAEFLTGGSLVQGLSSRGLLGHAFDQKILKHCGVSENSDAWKDSWDKVVVVNVSSIREAWVDYGEADVPQAVRDIVSAYPPLATYRKQDYFFDFLVIDPFHRLVVGLGLGYKHHMFTAVSVDGENFTIDLEDDEEEGEQWWSRIDDLFATRPFNIVEHMRDDLGAIAELEEERYNLPSEWELDEALESESEEESEEAEEQLERLEEIGRETEEASRMFHLLLPSFGESNLTTYLRH
jgi:hypothetical protein